jgi:formylmethanofuran dehydrogenase subunit E-like metal-binding protein
MWKMKFDFTSREKLVEQVIDGLAKNDTKTVDSIMRHDRDGFLFQETTFKLLDDKNETAWTNLMQYSADRAGPSQNERDYVFKQLLLGNCGVRGTAAMFDATLTAAEKKGLKVDFDLDNQLAFFIGGSDKDPRWAAISDVLVKHGADVTKAQGIIETWGAKNLEFCDQRIAELQDAVAEATQKRALQLEHNQTSVEAAKKLAAKLKPAAG